MSVPDGPEPPAIPAGFSPGSIIRGTLRGGLGSYWVVTEASVSQAAGRAIPGELRALREEESLTLELTLRPLSPGQVSIVREASESLA